MADDKRDEAAGEKAERDKIDPFVIHLATFEPGRPFEVRKGAFHSYINIPFIGWLDPTHLNIVLFVLALALILGVPPAVKRVRMSRSEKETPVKLALMREAAALFTKETTWKVPNLTALVRVGRLEAIPEVDLHPYHQPSSAVKESSEPDDAGGWRFDPGQTDPRRMISVNCTHTDRHGRSWADY